MAIEQRVHLWEDHSKDTYRNGNPGPVSNTRCRSNIRNYVTTRDPVEVTCLSCQRQMPRSMYDPSYEIPFDPPEKPPIPHATVIQIAENIREVLALKDKQAATMALMIRSCLAALRKTPTSRDDAAKRKQIKDDRAKALLYLEYLATQLEHQSVREPNETEGTDHVSGDQIIS